MYCTYKTVDIEFVYLYTLRWTDTKTCDRHDPPSRQRGRHMNFHAETVRPAALTVNVTVAGWYHVMRPVHCGHFPLCFPI
jgi:hypothetical protein